MPQTRSVTKRCNRYRDAHLSLKPKSIQREATLIEVSLSDTGLGTHIRWIHPEETSDITEVPETESKSVDERFVTPAPQSPQTPAAPRKPLTRESRIGGVGLWDLISSRNFLMRVPENAERWEIAEMISLEARNRGALVNTDSIRWENDPRSAAPFAEEDHDDPFQVGPSTTSTRRIQKLRRSDTVLVEEHDRPILGSPFKSRPSTPRTLTRAQPPRGQHLVQEGYVHKRRTLGPCGTILVGPDGRPITP